MSVLKTSRAMVAVAALTAADWKRINAALAKDEADDHEHDYQAVNVADTRRRVYAVLDALELRP